MREGRVIQVPARATYDLRRRVFRVGTPSTDVEWPGDDLATTVHLAVVIGEHTTPLAISTWLLRTSPDVDADPIGAAHVGFQLRGMATDPSPGVRGHGFGSLLLRTGTDRARSSGATHVWANARTDVLDFYRSHEFSVVGDQFLSADTAIPHHRILRMFD